MKKQRVIRSQSDLKGFNDDERDFPPSIVDSSGYEPLGELVKKFMRGERKARFVPQYEVDGGLDPETAIERMDVTRTDGFDLVDGARIAKNARKTFDGLVSQKTREVPEKGQKPANNAVESKPTPAQPAPEAEPKAKQ